MARSSLIKSAKLLIARNVLGKLVRYIPDCVVILGSGLSGEIDFIEDKISISFKLIPFFPSSNVKGHSNRLIFGKVFNRYILFQLGRAHLYEGFSAFEVAFPVAVYGELGIKNLIITNASGGINSRLKSGEIMMISDHINFQGENSLIKLKDGPIFLDSSHLYDTDLYHLLNEKFGIKKGIYIGVKGPNFETPSEIKAFGGMGADAIGMSTIQEVLMAKYYGMRVIGLSVIANPASGLVEKLSHEDVITTTQIARKKLLEVILEIIRML